MTVAHDRDCGIRPRPRPHLRPSRKPRRPFDGTGSTRRTSGRSASRAGRRWNGPAAGRRWSSTRVPPGSHRPSPDLTHALALARAGLPAAGMTPYAGTTYGGTTYGGTTYAGTTDSFSLRWASRLP